MVASITDASFALDVIQSKIPVLVDFWAPWCGPCQMIGPVLEEISKDLEDKVSVFKMNIDENPIGPGKLGVMSIPTLILFKDGEVLGRQVGVKSKEALVTWINAAI